MSQYEQLPFTICTAPQRSEEWFQARLGRLTGSRAADMLATIKTGEAASRKNLRTQLVLERITGRVQENSAVSAAMQTGIEREPVAYKAYEQLTGQQLTTTGFLTHTALMVGCSLDGHVGDFDGLIEIKCPQPATHLSYLRSGTVPWNYQKQVLHALWITGAEWCDWFSFNPDFPPALQIKKVRVWRDDSEIALYELDALQFLAECEREYQEVMNMTK